MSAAENNAHFARSAQDIRDVYEHDDLWEDWKDVEGGDGELAIVNDRVKSLQLHNPAQLAQELESTNEFITRTWDEMQTIQQALPPQGSESAIDALRSKLMKMSYTPGVLSAMEDIGVIHGYREALKKHEELEQMLKITEDNLKSVQELVQTSQFAIVPTESPVAQSPQEQDRVTELERLADFYLDERRDVDMTEFGTAIQNINDAMSEGRFDRASLPALNTWLSWDSENTLVPNEEKNPLPYEYSHQKMLTLVHRDTKLIRYDNLYQLIKTLHDQGTDENMLQKVACTLEQVLLKICRTTAEEQPNLVCLRLIELLAYCTNMSKISELDHCLNLFKIWKVKLSHQIRGDTLLSGLATFVETHADGSANQYETIGYCLRKEAQKHSHEFPSKPNDQRFLIADNEKVIIIPRAGTSIRIAQVDEVDLLDDREKIDFYVIVKRFDIKYKLEVAHEVWFARHFPTVMRATFTAEELA